MDDETPCWLAVPGRKHKQEIDRTAKSIIDTMNTELMVKATVSIGTLRKNKE